MNYYLQTFKKSIQFTGRATRKEYWIFSLMNFSISIALVCVAMIADTYSSSMTTTFLILFFVFQLIIILPTLAVAVRRLHDSGNSGWWLLIGCIPIVGGLLLFVMLVLSSQKVTNKYGSYVKDAKWSMTAKFSIFIGVLALFCVLLYSIAQLDTTNYDDQKTGANMLINPDTGELLVEQTVTNMNNTIQGPVKGVKLYCGLTKKEINFAGEKYYLAFSNELTNNYQSMEFVPSGDVTERYNRMILVHCNTNAVTHGQGMMSTMQSILTSQGNEGGSYPIATGNDRLAFDFVVGEENFFQEWDMFSYSPFPNKQQGYIMFGISARAYIDDDNNDYQNFDKKSKEFKKQYEDALINFDLSTLMK